MARIQSENAVRYIVEAPPVPIEALPLYLINKFKRETYEMECMWAGGTGFNFSESNEPRKPEKYTTRATLPRFHEYMSPKTDNDAMHDAPQENTMFDYLEALAGKQ